MAHTRSSGTQKDGGENGSSRRSAAVKIKDLKSSTTGSSANGSSRSKSTKHNGNARETRSSSARDETNSANLRRSNRETAKKPNIPTPSRKTSTPSSQKSTQLENLSPIPSNKKRKKVAKEAQQSSSRKSKRIKNNASTSSPSKDSNRTSSSTGTPTKNETKTSPQSKDSNRTSSSNSTPEKNEKKQVSIESQKKNKKDPTQHASRPSKKQKRLDAKGYREHLLHLKRVAEEAKSPAVSMDEENASEQHVANVNTGVAYEENCNTSEDKENQTHLDKGANEVLLSSTPGSHEPSMAMLEKEGFGTDVDTPLSFSEDVRMDKANALEGHVDGVNTHVAYEENCNALASFSKDVRIDEKNASERHVANVNAGVAHSDVDANELMQNCTPGLHEPSMWMLEKEGLGTNVDPPAPSSKNVKMYDKNAVEGHVTDVNTDVAYEENCNAPEYKENRTCSKERANEVLQSPTPGSRGPSMGTLEQEGHGTDGNPPSSFSEVLPVPFHKLERLPDGCPVGLDNDHLCSVNQLREFWHKSRGAVFVDNQERVIKTVLFSMSILPDVGKPFLIVSTSASLWEKKFNRLAPAINVVVYNGDKDARKSIQDLHFNEKGGCIVFQVLLSHPDAILEDIEIIECIGWGAVIVDECQNSRVSKCLEQLKRLSTNFRMVLLCSQLKDNLHEYINLLSFLDPSEKDTCDSVSNIDSADTVGSLAMLKEKFAHYVAYERKADSSKFLEYWVPARLSHVQLELYCATLLSNSSALRSSSKVDHVGALRTVLISLRKCCDHPYLVDQLLQKSLIKGHPATEFLDIGVHASGKLLLLDKMLKEISNKKLKVVILFQSAGGAGNPMGDILEDFVSQRFGPESYERVERGMLMSKKLAAMNMFNDKSKERFVFLIDHRACLPSIKLSSVDSIIIYGSDWNPLNDLKVLQKISIESQSEQVSIFRLYSSCTVEEKALVLAKQDSALDSHIQSIIPSVSHSLLSWGASFLFERLDEIQQDNRSCRGSDADKQFLDIVVSEFLTKLPINAEASTEKNSSAISKAHLNGTYSRNITVVGEREGISALDGDPRQFWLDLLGRRYPIWQYISEPTERSRRKVQNTEDPVKLHAEDNDETRRKRRKIGEIMGSMSSQVPSDKSKDHALPENSTPSSSDQHSLDETWQELVEYEGEEKLRNIQKILHAQLKPELLQLCAVLGLPYNVKCLAEQFLEYIMNNHQVSQEPKGILQSFKIALCWRAASFLRHKVDRRESLALAAKYLKYESTEELTKFVYGKLKILKEKFSHVVHETSNKDQPAPVEVPYSTHGKETCLNFFNDSTMSNHAAFVHSKRMNGALQEGPLGNVCTEQLVSEGQELISVLESHREQQLLRNEVLKKIRERQIDLVDMVFSLRKQNILDKQQEEITKIQQDREKEVIKLKKVCDLVLEHVCRTHVDPELRNGRRSLIIKWFTMLLHAFGEHMSCQCKKLEALQSAQWAKEQLMKNKFLQEAKSGQLDESFDRSIPLPDSNFVMEEFSYFMEQDDMCNKHETCDCQHSSDDSSMMEITLVRNVIQSEAVSTEAVCNRAAIIDSEGQQASKADLQENRSLSTSDGIAIQQEVPLAAHHLSSSCPACGDSVIQELSVNEHRIADPAEAENISGSVPSLIVAAPQHLGDVQIEVNADNTAILTADSNPPIEVPSSTAQSGQATLPAYREVERQTYLISPPANQSLASLPQLRAEAEQPVTLGAVHTQPSLSLSEMQPSTSMSNVHAERIHHDNQSQIDHQLNTMHGPGQFSQIFLAGPMMYNHLPVGNEPLKNELLRLGINGDLLIRNHEQKKLRLQSEYNQEQENLRRKYELLFQEEDSTFLENKRTYDDLFRKVAANQSLAEDFRVKFIATSVSRGRAPSPPLRQPPQASQQVSMRSSPVVATTAPIASTAAARPPMPTSLPLSRPHVQLSQVAGLSFSSQMVRPSSSVSPGNLVRPTASPFSQMPPPHPSYGARNDQPRAPAPHLQRSSVRLLPPISRVTANLAQHSVVPTNQQLPARLGVTSRTQVAPATPVDLTASGSHPAILPPSSSQAVPVPPSSHPPPPRSLETPPEMLPPSSLNTIPASRGTSVSLDVPQGNGQIGACITNMQHSESESASLDKWLISNLGLSGDPPGTSSRMDVDGDVVCISDED